jgi:hypothetical protein
MRATFAESSVSPVLLSVMYPLMDALSCESRGETAKNTRNARKIRERIKSLFK